MNIGISALNGFDVRAIHWSVRDPYGRSGLIRRIASALSRLVPMGRNERRSARPTAWPRLSLCTLVGFNMRCMYQARGVF